MSALLLGLASLWVGATPEAPVTRIAIGSCANQDRPQPIWTAIEKTRPDRFLFIGDNIYADTNKPAVMKAKYEKLARIPEFARFRAKVPILPVWDDHDYGRNDAGAEYRMKKAAQRLFLDFFEVPKTDPRRKRAGVYHTETFGPPEQRVQVILLDARYFRSRPVRRPEGAHFFYGRYGKNEDPKATVLGDAQWRWLKTQLEVPAKVRIIASGIQIVSEDHGFEKWMNFPKERARLYQLIKDTKATGVIFTSGDRHKGELSMMDGGVGYPLYDLTASGLNRGFDEWYWFEENRHRVAVTRWGNGFGLIRIDWSASDPRISLEFRHEDGEIAFSRRIRLSTLQPGALPPHPSEIPFER